MECPHAAGQVGAAQGRLQQATHRLGYYFVLAMYIQKYYAELQYWFNGTVLLVIKNTSLHHLISSTHHAQHSSSLADGRHQVLIQDLVLWWVELLEFHQGGEHHVKLVPLCEQVRHRQQLQNDKIGQILGVI